MYRTRKGMIASAVGTVTVCFRSFTHTRLQTGGVLAYTFGPQTDATCRELLALLTPFNIGILTTDESGS